MDDKKDIKDRLNRMFAPDINILLDDDYNILAIESKTSEGARFRPLFLDCIGKSYDDIFNLFPEMCIETIEKEMI